MFLSLNDNVGPNFLRLGKVVLIMTNIPNTLVHFLFYAMYILHFDVKDRKFGSSRIVVCI